MARRCAALALLACLLAAAAEFTLGGRVWKTYGRGRVEADGADGVRVVDDRADAGAGIWCEAPAAEGCSYRLSAALAELSGDGVFLQLRFLPSKKIAQRKWETGAGGQMQLTARAPAGTTALRAYIYAQPGKTDFRIQRPSLRLHGHARYNPQLLRPRPKALTVDRATAIVLPDDGSFGDAAQALRAAAGVALPVFRAAEAPRGRKCYILLGNRNTNALISDLYDRHHCIVDLDYPGPGGHAARTLLDPAGDGVDYILAGGSDENGVRAAAECVAQWLKAAPRTADGARRVPFAWDIRLSRQWRPPKGIDNADTYDQSAGYGPRYFGWNLLARHLAMFHATGDARHARRFLALAFPKRPEELALLRSDPSAFRNPGDPLASPYHYIAPMANLYWSMVENHPAFSDEERAAVTAALFRQYAHWRDTANGCGIFQTGTPADCVGSRHQQWAALSLYTVARHLAKVYPEPELAEALRAVENSFASLGKYRYVLGEGGNLTWFPSGMEAVPLYLLLAGKKGRIPRHVLHSLHNALATLAGNTPRDRIIHYVPLGMLRRLAWLMEDQAPLEIEKLLRLPPGTRLGQSFAPGPRGYATNTAPPPRTWLVSRPESEAERREWKLPFADPAAAFHFASWREDNHGGDFILIDGHLDTILRQPLHALALFTLTLDQMPLLAGYLTHLWARRDGIAFSAMPSSAEGKAAAAVGSTAAFIASLPVSPSADWERAVLRIPGAAVVADTITERERKPQQYDLVFNWEHGPGIEARPGDRPGKVRLVDRTAHAEIEVTAASPCRTVPEGVPTKRLTSVPTLLCQATAKGQRLVVEFSTGQPFEGILQGRFYAYTDRGSCNLYLDGRLLREGLSLHSARAQVLEVDLGRHALPAGVHRLELEAAAPSPTHPGKYTLAFVALLMSHRPFETREGGMSFCDPVAPRQEQHRESLADQLTGNLSVYAFPATLSADAPRTWFTLFTPRPAAETACTRLAPNAAMLRLPAPALVRCGQPGEGRLLLATENAVHGVAIQAIGDLLRCDAPVNLEWRLEEGDLRVEAPRPCTLHVGGKALRLPVGASQHKAACPPEVLRAHRAWLAALLQPAAADTAETAPPDDAALADARPLSLRRQARLGGFPAAIVRHGDRLAVAAGRNIRIYDLALNPTGVLKAEAPVGCLVFADGGRLVAAGCKDEKVVAFDPATGARKWEFVSAMTAEIQKKGATWFYKQIYPGIYGLAAGKFLPEGEQLFIGSASTLEVLGLDGKLLRREDILWGPVNHFALFPAQGTPTLAMSQVYPGQEYLTCFTPKFRRRLGYHQPPPGASAFPSWMNCNRTGIEVADLDGDGKPEIVSGLNGFWNRIVVWNDEGRPLHEVSFGPGFPITVGIYGRQRLERAFLADVKVLEDGPRRRIAAATVDGLLLFDRDLRKLWRRRLPAPPLLLAATRGRIAVGCRDGTLAVFDPAGRATHLHRGDAPWVELLFLSPSRLLAANADGHLCLFDL